MVQSNISSVGFQKKIRQPFVWHAIKPMGSSLGPLGSHHWPSPFHLQPPTSAHSQPGFLSCWPSPYDSPWPIVPWPSTPQPLAWPIHPETLCPGCFVPRDKKPPANRVAGSNDGAGKGDQGGCEGDEIGGRLWEREQDLRGGEQKGNCLCAASGRTRGRASLVTMVAVDSALGIEC